MSAVCTAMVPDVINTRVAIGGAVERIEEARGRDLFDYYGLYEQRKRADEMVAFAVLRGHGLEIARSWAIQSALIRDAQQTHEESCAAHEAVAS